MTDHFYFYLTTYHKTILYSLPYLVFCSLIGLFVILKKTSLLSFALAKMAHVSFILSLYFLSLVNQQIFAIVEEGHLREHSSALFALDSLWGILLLVLFFVVFQLAAYAKKFMEQMETFWAIMIAVFAGLIHLLNKLISAGDHIAYSSYFTELLYTPFDWFLHYLPYLTVFVVVFVVFMKPIFLTGFDGVQASILKMKKNRYELIFFTLAVGVIAISSRLLGIYLTLTTLLLPGYLALSFRTSLTATLFITLGLSLFFGLTGFASVFYFDDLPSEPVFIVMNFLFACFILLFRKN